LLLNQFLACYLLLIAPFFMIESPVWFSKAPRFSGETRPRNPQRFRSETGARAAAAPG